ncbi:MAG TPA: integrin alpha [Planctomycetota bacterium]|nr:integrin alpha [Planctomycetota bacterium]
MKTRTPGVVAALLALAPVALSQQKIFTAPGSAHGGGLGSSIALIGSVNGDATADRIVGAPFDDVAGFEAGRVRILSGTNGALIREHLGAAGDQYGTAVCAVADANADGVPDYVIGAPFADPGGLVDAGRVELRSGATGALIRTWNGAAAGDHFGSSLSAFGSGAPSRFLAGAPDRDSGPTFSVGAVYLLLSSTTTPVHEYLGTITGQLGASVEGGAFDADGDGNLDFAAGAPAASVSAGAAGRVQVFRSVAPFTPIFTVDGTVGFGRLGKSLAFVGDVNGDAKADLAVGEPGAGVNGAGTVRVVSGANGSTLKTLLAPNPTVSEEFGAALSRAGDFDGDGKTDVLVGAPFHPSSGRVYAFSTATAALLHEYVGPFLAGRFGTSVVGGFQLTSATPIDFCAGAPVANNGGFFAGAAVQVTGSNGASPWIAFGPVIGDHVGSTVAGLGDLDADGVPDWVVCSPELSRREFYSGKTGAKLLTAEGPEFTAGASIAGVGDVDLDGVPDYAFGVPSQNVSPAHPGWVLVQSGLFGANIAFYAGAQDGDAYGNSVAAAGDVDGDGVPDVLIGAPLHDAGPITDAGRVEVRSGATGSVLLDVAGGTSGEALGFSVAGGNGDFDGDGHPDVIAGAPGLGHVYVLSAPNTFVAILTAPSSTFLGATVAGPGDLNGDGFPDVLAGAPFAGASQEGHVVAFFGGPAFVEAWQVQGDTPGQRLGWSLAALGDIDLDGSPELVAGGHPGNGVGQISRIQGRDGTILFEMTDAAAGTSFGAALGRIGDVTGDGLDDFVVGAPLSSLTVPNGGAGFLFGTGVKGTTSFGPGTPGCAGTEHLVTSEPPKVGASGMKLLTDHAPASTLGLALITDAQDLAGSDLFGLGVLLHVGVIGATFIANNDAVSDATGLGSAPMPIPNNPTLPGVTLYAQILWVWTSGCSLPPVGLSSTKGLAVTIQP